MSYCRFTPDSDVYAYDCDWGVQIWVTKKDLDRLCRTYFEAYQYLLRLRYVHGLSVPDYAIDALKADAEEESLRFTGTSEFVALADENARLRSCLSDDAENARLLLGEVHELATWVNILWIMFDENYCMEKDKAFCDGECPYRVDDETCKMTKAMDVLEKYGRAWV